MPMRRHWTKNRKLTEEEKDRILEAIISTGHGEGLKAFEGSGLSLSEFISRKIGIPKDRVAGVLAAAVRAWHDDPKSMRTYILTLLRTQFGRDPPHVGESISEWLSKRIGISKTRAAKFYQDITIRNRLRIIDATLESQEQKSESKHLRELFRIYNWNGTIKPKMVKAQTPGMFVKALRSATERCIHISAHGGRVPKRGAKWANPFETRIYSTPYAPLWLTRPNEIEGLGPGLWRNEKPELIVMVACKAGHNDMAQAFLRTGVKYFIAPEHIVNWDEASLFNTLFYYHYFVRRKSVPESFRETMELKDLKRGWRLFQKE